MTESAMVSHPVSTTMIETAHVTTSSMFVTFPETHLYGDLPVPPSYQLLSSTFSSTTSSPWNSPMSSSFGIISGTFLKSITQSTLYPPSTCTIQR